MHGVATRRTSKNSEAAPFEKTFAYPVKVFSGPRPNLMSMSSGSGMLKFRKTCISQDSVICLSL